jgi:hypothetical protein
MKRLLLLVPLFFLASSLSAFGGPLPDKTFALSPFTAETAEEESMLGGMITSTLSLLIPYQSGWSAAEPSEAAVLVKGFYREHAGSLRLNAELHSPPESGREALRFSLSGRAGETGAILVELATLLGEALESTFLPLIRPPAVAAPDYSPPFP